MMHNKIISVVIFSIFSAASFANIPNELAACTDIDNKELRLQCFDNFMAKQSKTENKAKTEIPQPLVLTSAPEGKALISAAVPPTTDVKHKKDQIQQQEEQQVKQNFGLEHKKTTEEEATESLTFTIKKAKKSVHGKWTLTFTNEQKWVTISSEKMRFKAEQEVIIRRGIFNSFMLKIADSNRSVKVKRIK
ncbi:hypothetical protein RGQ13_01370 [Thalassotalea psychrophila]|uniref:Uncharacterized protein n=1 Tax=Thalassotalea psychrophila TaxID=3065647 RepID=A0ABY9TV72_9GAMM|nr:hypothetical protein RGQ13_01370 [Colwelliaceae bacterium SQ149]